MTCMKPIATAAILAVVGLLSVVSATAQPLPDDPLQSVMWKDMAEKFLSQPGTRIVFDNKVKVDAPISAEDQMAIPATVNATGLGKVKRIVVFADLNPLPHVLTYEPVASDPYISFRFKVEQGTPIRAAALTADGVWHVGGRFVDAAGGGCSRPADAHAKSDWVSHLAEVRAKVWRIPGLPSAKLRMQIFHPMDTGLADGIPAFYLEALSVKTPAGRLLGRLQIREPVSENPTFTLRPHLPVAAGKVVIQGRDTEGNMIDVAVPAPWKSSALGRGKAG